MNCKKKSGNQSKMSLLIFWGTHETENYRDMVADLVQSYKAVGCNVSLEGHFLVCHLDFFPADIGTVSDELVERLHHNISTMRKQYQAMVSPIVLADYYWTFRRDVSQSIAECHPPLSYGQCIYCLQYIICILYG